MNKQFHSIHATYIYQLVSLKRQLGFRYRTEETILSIFDRFALDKGGSKIGITRELADAWINLRPNESASYKYHRAICLNQLASFLINAGIRSYVCQIPTRKTSFVPHIYSRSEMATLFRVCDEMKLVKGLRSIIIVIPTLIRLLYATGLRISEALLLRNRDVNLQENYLIVRDSKNGNERMLPFSDSLSKVCKNYLVNRNRIPVRVHDDDPFFVSLQGMACRSDVVGKWFKKVLWNAGIPRNDHGPRLHDLRHTFAVHALASMAESGTDLYCALPILSTYLGHQSLEATNQYVRLTAAIVSGVAKGCRYDLLKCFPNPKRL